jgi:hypothetical protein
MALRGALSRGINIGLGIVLVALPCLMVCIGYGLGISTGRTVLIGALVGYPLGVLAGLPAFVLNRKAVSELYDALSGKLFLSSQLALLDSRHGKNALAYFYVLEYLAVQLFPLWVRFWGWDGPIVWFAQAAYLSANVLPFVLPLKRKT